jgi:hypothetical protein
MKGERSHMKIKTMVNFKLRNNAPLMLKGIYDDSEEPFPKEIYEEIERNKSGKRRTLVILEDGKPKKVPAPASKSMEMLDKGAEIQTVESDEQEKADETQPEAQDSTESIETESDTTKKKKRATKKRIATKSTTSKSTTKKRAPKKKKTDE